MGVQRAISYLRYLPAAGCRVVALTASNPVTPVYDPALSARIPSGTPIYRVPTLELPYSLRTRLWGRVSSGSGKPAGGAAASGRTPGWKALLAGAVERLATPDPQKAWRLAATRAAVRIVEKEKIEAVLVSVPPFSSLRIGVQLKRRFPHLTLISDFRDEWVGFYLAKLDPPPSPYRLSVCRAEEAEAVEASDFVVTVTSTMRDSIRGRYPAEAGAKFLSVLNGYDPEELVDFQPRPSPSGELLVGYAGTLYENPLFTPLRWTGALEGLDAGFRDRIRTRLVGRAEGQVEKALKLTSARCELKGFLPKAQMFRELEDADVLLMVVGIPTSMGGKMFEYLATGKPILALTTPGSEVARLIDETRAGFWADLNDADAIRALAARMLEWKAAGKPFHPDRSRIERLSRRVLAAELARQTGLSN